MKHLAVLVGPPGSGKSTYWTGNLRSYVRISQDEQGRDGHMVEFEKALKSGQNIAIDRMNHTREQRARYISKAKEFGYETTIIEFFESYKVCYSRITTREGHPTIKVGDKVSARHALDTYFNQYEMIRYEEADGVLKTKRNPIMWDLTDLGGDAFVVGDIHGCYSDLLSGLREAGFDSEKSTLIACGDLVDRGPHIAETVKSFIMEPGWYTVRGNHDDKFIRWLRGNKVNTESLKETIAQIQEEFDNLDELYMDLVDIPYIIKFGDNYITHAGFYPDSHPMFTSREFCMYARKYDPSIRTFTNDNTKPYWYTFIPEERNYSLYFGHEIHETNYEPHPAVYAMDGGCYLGNKLRIAKIDYYGLRKMYEFDSSQPKLPRNNDTTKWDHMNKFEPYEKLVEQGYLNKQESGDLVLYNYSDQTQYSNEWNKYTIESRGLILNKTTGDTVARPFPKFWNMSELISENEIKEKKDENT